MHHDDASGASTPAWTAYADVLLQRAALVARLAQDRLPNPLAGLRVSDDDVLQLLSELPGLRGANDDAETVLRSTRPAVAEAGEALQRLLDAPDDQLAQVVRGAALTAAEAAVLALLAAVELDPRRQRLVGYLNDDVTQRWLTPYTLAVLEPSRTDLVSALAPGAGLRRAGLLQPPPDGTWASAPARLHPSVVWWLTGAPSLDEGLPAGVELLEVPGSGDADLLVAAGPDRVRRLQAVVRTARASGFLVTPMPADDGEWDAVVRQASLAGLAVAVELDKALPPGARARVDRAKHLTWALCSETDLPLTSLPRRRWVAAAVEAAEARPEEVRAMLGDGTVLPAPLTAEQLEAVATAARALDGDVESGIRRLAAGGIEQVADRLVPRRSWDDLVLPEPQLSLVREVADRATHRERVYRDWGFSAYPSVGVVAMFAGPSGTGKTLAAEVVARALGLDLYRVDLSRVVDKYIGETEKKLSEVFAAAEASPVVLFFDEADALLGKRSEVSDAHDRYANIEVAFLLQRLERHNGVVVLATNLAKNLDPAFLRRISVVVDFPMPEPSERLRIWELSVPDAARADELDLAFLADSFELAGGSIRNAAITAAFLAARDGSAITMETLVTSVKRELQKAGRFVRSGDFGIWADAVTAPPGPRSAQP
jgi:hypothetical protein